jgi:hypothetical protein
MSKQANIIKGCIDSFWILVLTATCGCIAVEPRPRKFVETTENPPSFHAAWSDGDKLILDVLPQRHGGAFYGMEVFGEAGDLYVYPNYEELMSLYFPVIYHVHSKLHMERRPVQTGTNTVARFTIDPAQFGMNSDWPAHVYWMSYPDRYPFWSGGFWSETHREPVNRRHLEVRPLTTNSSAAANAKL